MAKIPETVVSDEEFAKLIEDYQMTKNLISDEQEHLDQLLAAIESYTGVDKNSDFTGKKALISGNIKVVVTYKMNTSIDKERALKECSVKGINPLDIFNVNLSYSNPKFNDADEKGQNIIEATMSKSRGKSSIEITLA